MLHVVSPFEVLLWNLGVLGHVVVVYLGLQVSVFGNVVPRVYVIRL